MVCNMIHGALPLVTILRYLRTSYELYFVNLKTSYCANFPGSCLSKESLNGSRLERFRNLVVLAGTWSPTPGACPGRCIGRLDC